MCDLLAKAHSSERNLSSSSSQIVILLQIHRVWKAESGSSSTITQPLVPFFSCFPTLPWPGTATSSLLGNFLHRAMRGSTMRNQPVPRGASGCTSGRMTTERVGRHWKRLPKEVVESTSELITLEPLSCKKPQSGNSSRIDVLTFLSVRWDKG